ncbi:MAG: hypothetical protein JNM94_00320 [Phycisphaerae bacterium]|nr:hypothetical protein [Phycisphaerae bacterium]
MSNATADPRCVGCRYDLTGADVNANCPECGMAARLTVDSSVRDRYVGMQRLAVGLRRYAFSTIAFVIAGILSAIVRQLPRVQVLDEKSIAYVAAEWFVQILGLGSALFLLVAIVGLVRRPTTRAWPSLVRAARNLVRAIVLGIVAIVVATILTILIAVSLRMQAFAIAIVVGAAVGLAIDLAILRYLVAAASALHRIASWPRIVTVLLVVRFLAGCAAAIAFMAGTPFSMEAFNPEVPLTPGDRLAESFSFVAELVGFVVSWLVALSALRLSRNVEPASLALWAPEIPATNS